MKESTVGQYREYLTIEQEVETQDDDGAVLRTWSLFRRVWGSVRPTTGREIFLRQGDLAEVDYVIPIRYVAGIDSTMRVNLKGRLFDIKAVTDPTSKKRELQLLCTERP